MDNENKRIDKKPFEDNLSIEKDFKKLTIGCEAVETRNLAIYLHFGYTKFLTSIIEDDELILYFEKSI